ncbi:MAG: glycosyltransferase family 4 protein [Isosphaeraceae bacterium]|nr:glycosyltransferase family 4 protein [Isosphaeraceae bacterium]
MKIAWFTHRYHPCIGGAETYGRAVVKRFVRAGHEVDVFTSDAHELAYYTDRNCRKVDAPERSVVDGANVRRLPVRHYPLQRYVGKALSLVPHRPTQCRFASYMPWIPGLGSIRGDYDAVFGVGFPFTNFSHAALRTARAAGAPLILTPFLHLATPGDPVHRTYTRPHQISLLRAADLVINPTQRASETVISWGISSDRVATISMAIDRRDVIGGDRDRFRHEQSLSPTGPVIGQLGALDPNKGSCDLILACDRIHDRGRAVELVLAGNPTREFRRFLEEHPRERPWLRLTGPLPVSEVPSFYAALDIFSMPSRTDSFGIVFLEAWANGLPVVAADAGGVPEVVDDGRTGRLVPFGDVEALRAAFERWIDDPTERRRIGEEGRRHVEKGFDWDDRFDSILAHTRRLVESRGRRVSGGWGDTIGRRAS